jgi:hypothetical protein
MVGRTQRRVSMSQADGEQPQVEPLTRRNAEGELYRRDPAVERQIMDMLGLEAAAIVARAQCTDRAAVGYLRDEPRVSRGKPR